MKTRHTIVLSLLALALILCTVISPAMAYFTDHDQATGAAKVTLSGKTEIIDNYKDGRKTIAIQNTEGRDVWVRLLVAAGETYQDYLGLTPGGGWSDGGDGYWYYGSPVPAGSATSEFTVDISGVPTKELDKAHQEFNVAVLYETTPVQYDTDGKPLEANWDILLDTGSSGAGSTEGGESNG